VPTIATNLVVVTRSWLANIMQASGNNLIRTGDLHLARHVAMAGGIVQAVAALVVEALKLSTVAAFVVGTAGVALAVGDPRDEERSQLIAAAAVGWRCRWGGVRSGHSGERCGYWLSVSLSLIDRTCVLMVRAVPLI
jgi:hypothetical protein